MSSASIVSLLGLDRGAPKDNSAMLKTVLFTVVRRLFAIITDVILCNAKKNIITTNVYPPKYRSGTDEIHMFYLGSVVVGG